MLKHRWKLFGLILAVAAMVSCKSISTTDTDKTLAYLELSPSSTGLLVGESQQYAVLGVYSDSSQSDLTSLATWASSNSQVAAFDSQTQGLLEAKKEGQTQVTVSYGEVSRSLNLSVLGLSSLSLSGASALTLGVPVDFSATATLSDDSTTDVTSKATWSSSNQAVLSVTNALDQAGRVHANGSGTASLTASYLGISGSLSLKVSGATLSSIEITPLVADLMVGTSLNLRAMGIYSDDHAEDLTDLVLWKSSDSSIASLQSSQGVTSVRIKGVAAGSTSVTASYAGVSGSKSLSVSSGSLSSITLSPAMPNLASGQRLQLKAQALYSLSGATSFWDHTEESNWVSNLTNAFEVDKVVPGLIHGVSSSKATITASSGSVTGSTQALISGASLSSLELSSLGESLGSGTSRQIYATGIFGQEYKLDLTSQVDWFSNSSGVLNLKNEAQQPGFFTAVGTGTASLSATWSSLAASAWVKVPSTSLSSIEITPSSPSVPVGYYRQMKATGIYADGSSIDLTDSVLWSVANSNVALVSNDPRNRGEAYAKVSGSSTLYAAFGGVSGSTTFTASTASLSSLQITPSSLSISSGYPTYLAATGNFSDGTSLDLTDKVAWSSSASAVAVVEMGERGGRLVPVGTGTATITAYMGSVSGTSALTVGSRSLQSLQISSPSASLLEDGQMQLSATGIFSDNSTQDLTPFVIWSVSDPAIAWVDNRESDSGLMRGLAPGGFTATARLGSIQASLDLTIISAP